MTRLRAAGAALALFLLIPVCLSVHDARAADGETPRRVLGLYNGVGSEFGEPIETDIHMFLEKPINHLGLVIDYADVNDPLPDTSQYLGIIVWLRSPDIEKPERYLPWLLNAIRSGVKVVFPTGILTPMQPGGEEVQWELMLELFAALGLEYLPGGIGENGEELRINYLRPEFFGYETSAVAGEPAYPVYRPAREDVEVWQRVEHAANPEEYTAGVVVSDAGGWALSNNFLYYSTEVPGTIYRVAWNINPIEFLERALGCTGRPRPDVTTFWGARGAYAHIDVDGPYNMTQPDVPGPSRFSLEVVYEEILKKYPYPVTLGLIAAEYDPDLELRFLFDGESPEHALAREPFEWERPQREVAAELRRLVNEISTLPWVQYGCHGYTHALFWRDLGPSYGIRNYQPSYENEIRNAVRYLDEEVLPPGKKVELFQWTGDCNPPEEALDILADMGMANINGGDPLYDSRHNSLYFICGLSVPKGKRRQIYSSGSNENIYTVEWTGYKGAYNHVITTFKRSESPLRLLPVNLYYHVFPAERLAGYKAIQHAYDWAAKQDLCWFTAVEYVRAAEAFFPLRYGRTEDGEGWWVEDYGVCPTIRFDREERVVDMRASKNVAGYVHHNGSLYVALIPGERAEIRLATARPDAPCLARASGMLEDIEAGGDSWGARLRGWGPGFIELWVPEGEWRFTIRYPDGRREEKTVRPMADGRVSCALADAVGKWIEVRLEKN